MILEITIFYPIYLNRNNIKLIYMDKKTIKYSVLLKTSF